MTLVPLVSSGQSIHGLRTDIHHILDTIPGTFAVAFEPINGSEQLLINEKEMFHAASTMKTPVMIEVFKEAREGRFSLDDSLEVRNEFKSIVDGSSYELDLKDDSDDSMYKKIGRKVPIRELLTQMITISSNLATNLLIGLVGPENVTKTMRSLGAKDIEVLRGVEDGKAFDRGLNNRTDAFDLLVIMKSIARGRAVDSVSSEEMVNILLGQKFRDIIPALLPPDVPIAHKTGSITGVEHDSGIVFLPDGSSYVLVLLSKELKNAEEGKRGLALVSKRIYEFVLEGK
jgi:beta-lactamase class A